MLGRGPAAPADVFVSNSAGQQFDDQIEQELQAASAVVVIWTSASVSSRWVRGEARDEARDAADRGVLVPVRFDDARLPIDVRALQGPAACAARDH